MPATRERPLGARAETVEPGLAPPSAIPRAVVLTGALIGLAGVASVLEALVRGVLVGFGDPAASGGLSPPLALAAALLLGGGAVGLLGLLFSRADARRR